MFEKGPSKAFLHRIQREAEKDVAITTSAREAVRQTELIESLVSKAEKAEQEASKAVQISKNSNHIAIASIIISSVLAILAIVVAIAIGVGSAG